MAATNEQLAKSEVAVALLNFDNATLSATSVTVANTTGVNKIVIFLTISGVTVSGTALPGQSIVVNLPAGTTVFSAKGGFGITGLTNMNIGTG